METKCNSPCAGKAAIQPNIRQRSAPVLYRAIYSRFHSDKSTAFINLPQSGPTPLPSGSFPLSPENLHMHGRSDCNNLIFRLVRPKFLKLLYSNYGQFISDRQRSVCYNENSFSILMTQLHRDARAVSDWLLFAG